jgi:hypothetical protein
LRPIDRRAAKALGIVFQACVFIVVSWIVSDMLKLPLEYRRTFAESNTGLNRHVLGIGTTEEQGSWGAEIFETSSIFERSEVGARWLRRFLVPSHQDRSTASVDTGNECKCCGSSSKVVEVQHGEEFF